MKKTLAALAFASAAAVAEAAPVAVNSYTFIGRVMDSSHAAFDTNRVAKITAASHATGDPLARTSTYFRADTRCNYTLAIPMASEPAAGYAVAGSELDISVVDDSGKEWRGVVFNPVAEAPDKVREVDIVLGEDNDGDGIDDALYAQLEARWERSDYYSDDEPFDPMKDYDGDGISTIDEALSGTNPYDPKDVLAITGFSIGNPVVISFTCVGGRAYTVEAVDSLVSTDWKTQDVALDTEKWMPVNVIAVPNNPDNSTITVYLLPSSSSASFFRVKTQ